MGEMTYEEQIYWCVMGMQKFENLAVAGMPYEVRMDVHGIAGYLPIFTTREAAEEFSEGRFPISAIRATPPTPVEGDE